MLQPHWIDYIHYSLYPDMGIENVIRLAWLRRVNELFTWYPSAIGKPSYSLTLPIDWSGEWL